MQIQFRGDSFVNLAVMWGSDSRGVFCPLITDCIPDLHAAGGVPTQCFPMFLYELVSSVEQHEQLEIW